MSYANRLRTEAELQDIDAGLDTRGQYQTLATMARKPATIAAVNKAREVASKDRYWHLNKTAARMIGAEEPSEAERNAIKAVWDTLPGYTCFMDALAITARL